MSKEGLPSPDHLTANDIQRNNAQLQSAIRNNDELENHSSTNHVTSDIPLEAITRTTNHRSDPTNVISSTQFQRTDTDINTVLHRDLGRYDAPSNARRLRDILEEVLQIADDVLVDIPDTCRRCVHTEGSRSLPLNDGDRSLSQDQHENDYQQQEQQQEQRQKQRQ
jgi:hypothetical protein